MVIQTQHRETNSSHATMSDNRYQKKVDTFCFVLYLQREKCLERVQKYQEYILNVCE